MQKFKQKKSKFVGDDGVKTPLEMMHFLPFAIQKRRINENGEKMPVKVVKDYGNFYLEYIAPEPINITDIKRLIGIFKFFQDNEKNIITSEIPTPGGKKIVISINNISFFQFCKHYTNCGKGNEKNIAESLSRLNNYTIIRTKKTNTINKIPTKYLYDYSIKDNIASFSVLKTVYDRIKKEGLILKFDTLLKIKGNVAVSLYIFLISQNKLTFKESTIFNAIGLSDSRESRRELKEAFYQLRTIQFLTFKDDKLIRKEKDGNYYGFIY